MTRHPSFDVTKHRITILEASKIAGGASGKAGGLLALWAYPTQIVPLSYRLHASLAKEHNGAQRWGYRKVHCGHLEAYGRPRQSEAQSSSKQENGHKGAHISLEKKDQAAMAHTRGAELSLLPSDLDWIAKDTVKRYKTTGTPDTTAQVHPYHFTTAMAELAKECGAKIEEHARVTAINKTGDGKAVESVRWIDKNGIENKTTASHVVVCAGPWTARVLEGAPISGLRAHSVTIRPQRDVSNYALFTDINLPSEVNKGKKGRAASKQQVAPEIYARPFREVYACGEGDQMVPLPDTTAEVETDHQRCQDIVNQVSSISDELRDGEVTARQACYLPVSSSGDEGGPWIGELASTKGLILASGHTCWGIQNGPGTGKCVSEIILDGAVKSTKLGQLDPKVSLKRL